MSKQDYGTPLWLFKPLNERFRFTLDVCASVENAKCKDFYTEEQDGLVMEWNGRCWCNPPYGNIPAWLAKAHIESSEIRGGTLTVCLVPNDCSTTWYEEFAMKAHEIIHIGKRVKFIGANGTPSFSSIAIVFKPWSFRKTPKHTYLVFDKTNNYTWIR